MHAVSGQHFYGNLDVFSYLITQFFSLCQLAQLCCMCKQWCSLVESLSVWQLACIKTATVQCSTLAGQPYTKTAVLLEYVHAKQLEQFIGAVKGQ